MSTVVKCSDLITQFNGCQGQNFGEWCDKLELVAKIQKIKDVSNFMPLFLSGGAFEVYQSLKEDVKSDFTLLKSELMAAFSMDPTNAYVAFSRRTILPNESVDVYLASLRRLARLISVEPSDDWIKVAFLAGLPEDVKMQLTAMCRVNTLSLSELVEKARNIIGTNKTSCLVSQSAVKESETKEIKFTDNKNPYSSRSYSEVVCYQCGGKGHISRQCPSRKSWYGNKRTEQQSGNEKGKM